MANMINSDYYIELGQRFANARRDLKLTQLDVAKRLKLDRSSIAQVETGQRRSLDIQFIMRMCEILKLDINEFQVIKTGENHDNRKRVTKAH